MFEDSHTNQASLPEPAGDLIRRAEQMIASSQFASAITLLDQASLRQPDNQYILAIRQRAELLQHASSSRNGSDRVADSGARYLNVTIGKQFADGIKPEAPHATEEEETKTRVQRLTIIATRLFERGEFDSAFESLMKAYLLDPNSPRVIACEKTMMPLWEMMRARGVITSPRKPVTEATSSQKARTAPPASEHSATSADLDRERRLRDLLERKDQERKERERAMWRNASNPPRTSASPEKQSDPPPPHGADPPGEEPHGLLWRLRNGRIRG
jgi:tetratricopeptide (TPR) repeat protein